MTKPRIKSQTYAKLQRIFNGSNLPHSLTGLLNELPNPDPILRKAGFNTTVYQEIMTDPHVIGELRSLRAGLFTFNAELEPGGTDKASMDSYELVKSFFAQKPAKHTEWSDIDWHSYCAILMGFTVTHLNTYTKTKGHWLPSAVSTWDNSKFAFDRDHNLIVKTLDNPRGELTDKARWTCVRHMPQPTNPYGIALLSSCFWPWQFKKGGFTSLVRLVERFGIPFPVGKYNANSGEGVVDEVLDGLVKLLEDGLAAIPDDATVDILESKFSGEPLPAFLIDICNAEISKALTSQTLATEQKGGGARAAAETHAKRAGDNQRADRALVASNRNQICRVLHDVNFDGGSPPVYRFKDKKDINADTVSRVRETARLISVPEDWVYKELCVPQPNDDQKVIKIDDDGKGIATQAKSSDFSAADNLGNQWDAFDAATSAEVTKIFEFAKSADSLQELKDYVQQQFPGITAGPLAEVTKLAFEQNYLQGAVEADKLNEVTQNDR